LAILTLVGGTVGGYISFSGGHRLVDAGIVGEENLSKVNQSALMGMGVATIIRIFLFLAVLGVVSKGVTLDATNPAADAFRVAAGTLGYKIFGLVMSAAALTSVVGAAFTSVSFLRTLIKPIGDHVNITTIAFIVASTAIQIFVGSPAKVLVIVGSLNGLILPLTLGTILVASKRKDIVGEYKHAQYLFILGWIVVAITAVLGLRSLTGIASLWK
jgi:Mn2+/Fe2+ NRAMP family transporter